jgi:hypothetical protein
MRRATRRCGEPAAFALRVGEQTGAAAGSRGWRTQPYPRLARRRGWLSGRPAASRLPVAPGCRFPPSRSRSRLRGFPAIGAAGCVPAAHAAACERPARAASGRHRGRPRAGAARGEWRARLELGQEFGDVAALRRKRLRAPVAQGCFRSPGARSIIWKFSGRIIVPGFENRRNRLPGRFEMCCNFVGEPRSG